MALNPSRGQAWLRPEKTHVKKPLALFLLCLLAAITAGCGKKIALRPPLTEVQKKFEEKCRKDYHLNIVTRLVNKTFWIYAPTDKPLFTFAAEPPGPPNPTKKIPQYDLLYVDGAFKGPSFYFEYDIIPKIKSHMQSEGVRNEGTDYFNKLYTNLFTAITENLLDPQISISFVVLTICDIKKGIEVRYTFYLEDYRRASVEAIPYDEFLKRILQDSKGSTDFIGDEIGQHLKYTNINMPDFLAKQMINRIRFKFTQSDFPPQDGYEKPIIDIIADTIRYYQFKDFKDARLNDLRAKKKAILTRDQLDIFGEDRHPKKEKTKGKLIHVIFDNGKTTFTEEP